MRTLHLVDIENLCLGDLSVVDYAFDEYLARAGYAEGDILIIGLSHFSLRTFAGNARWAQYGFRVESGPDGADRALMTAIHELPIEGRYGRVIVGSGDGGFADEMAALGRLVTTAAIAVEGSLSRRLAVAVNESFLIPRPMAEAA